MSFSRKVWTAWYLLSVGMLLVAPRPAAAQVTVFGSRALFNAANPGLPIEDFEAANVAGSFVTFTGPLNSATNNGTFTTGNILPGISLVDDPGPGANDLLALGTGAVTGATKAVGNFTSPDALDLLFAPGVSAVGFDLFAAGSPGRPVDATVVVQLFDGGGQISSTLVPTGGDIVFVGFSSVTPIVRVSLLGANQTTSRFVDNVAFGSSIASAAPEPASLALLGVTGLPVVGAIIRRRHTG
jgi:hypothetical protein